MNPFWHILAIIVPLVSMLSYIIFVFMQSRTTSAVKADESTGHYWDGITELNQPLPKWWFYTFIGLALWAIGFMFYYPALGNMAGMAGWTQEGQYREELKANDARYEGYYESITAGSLTDIAKNPDVQATGRRLFLNNCAVCHTSDAAGNTGYPNLTDNDWLYGGEPESILASISNGRSGLMPEQKTILEALAKPVNIADPVGVTAEYILTLSGLTQASDQSGQGKTLFDQSCMACHGPDGKGMHALGAPDLTDNIWLYVDSADAGDAEKVRADIIKSINEGRNGVMPAHKNILSEGKVKVLAAYIYSLSNTQ